MYDIAEIRSHFPILSRQVNGKPLVYLDNGASAQKPQVVIDAVTTAYTHEYANVHRGLHYLSNLATDKYEAARTTIARFLNAPSDQHIVFSTGTTEAINLSPMVGRPRVCSPAMKSSSRSWNTTPTLCRGIFCANAWVWC